MSKFQKHEWVIHLHNSETVAVWHGMGLIQHSSRATSFTFTSRHRQVAYCGAMDKTPSLRLERFKAKKTFAFFRPNQYHATTITQIVNLNYRLTRIS
jgi:hypothetical protein